MNYFKETFFFTQLFIQGELSDDVSLQWLGDTSTNTSQRTTSSCHNNNRIRQQYRQHGGKAIWCENNSEPDNYQTRLATNEQVLTDEEIVKQNREVNKNFQILSKDQQIKEQLSKTETLCTSKNNDNSCQEIVADESFLSVCEYNNKHNGVIAERLHGTEAEKIGKEIRNNNNVIQCWSVISGFVESEININNPRASIKRKLVENNGSSVFNSFKFVENDEDTITSTACKEFDEVESNDSIIYNNTNKNVEDGKIVEYGIVENSGIVADKEDNRNSKIFKTINPDQHQYSQHKTWNYNSTTTTNFNIDRDFVENESLTFNTDERLVGFADNENLASQFSREKVLNWKVSIL